MAQEVFMNATASHQDEPEPVAGTRCCCPSRGSRRTYAGAVQV